MAQITESAKSWPNMRSLEAIRNCSAIIFDGIHNERRWRPLGEGRGGCQIRTTSSLVYVSEASKPSQASSSGTKSGCIFCERREW